ncbi:MAG: hypothetical protein M3R35_01585 [Candidatus Eremiobacteraeota bacterium]|nr:hypothetical protein [Candidatus Eremiobacteraeota bacterium]
MRIALTCNGPGEMAGWVRPLLRRIYALAPETEAHIFCVPDEYATGQESALARELFPNARVYDPKTYVQVALGRAVPCLPASVDVVQYLGGDLMHASRLHSRLGGRASAYKFSRPRLARRFARFFAVDDANVAQLLAWQTPLERILKVGNLAIDGALLEVQQPAEKGAPRDGVLFMPGSRRYEVEHLIPFFLTAALRMTAESPSLPIAFGISPFTSLEAVRRAVEAGGHPRIWAQKGRLIEDGADAYLTDLDGRTRFPILRNALSAAAVARLVVTIPGTKMIELAALGKPAVSITPLNAPEEIAINGPLTYLNRIPLVGAPLKRAVAAGVSRRFRFHTQPNIDADEMLIHEMHGTLTPGRVARVVLERFDDTAWLERSGRELATLYRAHAGASERMARSLLELAA